MRTVSRIERLCLVAGLVIAFGGSTGFVYAQTRGGIPADTAPLSFDPNRDVDIDTALPIGIVGWWRFDEGEGFVARDAAGANTGRLVGFEEPRWLQGQLGRALAFHGTGSNAVVIPSAPALNPPQQVSLSAWIYSFTGGRSGPEIIISKDGGQLTQYSLRIENPGLVRFTVGNMSLSAGVHIVPNNWHHVVASFDGRVMRLFVDGVAEPRSLEGPGSIPTTEYPVRIGSGSNARQPMAFNGLLDDVRIYARGLNFVDAASLYREGVENSNSAFIKHAQVSQYSDIYKINNPIASQVPNELIQPWWYSYLSLIEDNGEPPEIKWELACGTLDDTGKLLSCFLKLNPKVRDSIVWVDADPNFHTVIERTYTQWSPARKQQLNTAFFHAFQWMKGGLQTFNGTMLLDPPINQLLQPDAAPAQTGLATDAAWQLYLNTIAHSLAVEIGGFVPWSITGYTTDELQTLFHSKYMFNAGWLNSWANYPDPTPWFGYQPAGDTMEAPPTTFFQFLVDNDMIRGNHEATIERLIDWSRFHLLHILDWEDISALAFEGWWDYRGASPASRILAGTIGRYKTIPPYPEPPPHNWIYGCHGVVTLYRGLLRTINIPVDYRTEFGHAMPVWWTVGKSLSHGDDVEFFPFKNGSDPGDPSTWQHWHKHPKASEYPITLADFSNWFEGPNQDSVNVGRRVFELLFIKYPDDDHLNMYCYDTAHALSHANGTVLASVQGSPYLQLYPVATLEAIGFWNTLASEAAQFGFCGP
jgi:hypothetical protein